MNIKDDDEWWSRLVRCGISIQMYMQMNMKEIENNKLMNETRYEINNAYRKN